MLTMLEAAHKDSVRGSRLAGREGVSESRPVGQPIGPDGVGAMGLKPTEAGR